MEDSLKLQIENINTELNKVKLLIEDVMENSEKISTDDNPALSCIKLVKALEKADYIINRTTGNMISVLDYYNSEVTETNNKLADEYVNNIIK